MANTESSNSRVPTPITTKQAAALLADIEQFQDCAMILAQQIEQHLEPIAGQDSPHFTAWRLSQMLRERLEDGWLQNNARQMLGVA